MPTTTNFGWTTPADTDLVKDGALAIRTLAGGIDTSFVDLKGGTTGQILSKATNTDLDFTWITNDVGDITAVTAGTGLTGGGTSGSVTVSLDSPVSATLGGTGQTSYTTGDLIYSSATNTLAKRAIGSTGQVLTVSGGVPTWAAPGGATGTIAQIVTDDLAANFDTTSGTYQDTGLSVTITPGSSSSKILVRAFVMNNPYHDNSGTVQNNLKLLRDSTALYDGLGCYVSATKNPTSGYLATAIPWTFFYVDSPATTSATTYKIQLKRIADGTAQISATSDQKSYIQVMELTQ